MLVMDGTLGETKKEFREWRRTVHWGDCHVNGRARVLCIPLFFVAKTVF